MQPMAVVLTRSFAILIGVFICACSQITDEQEKLIGVWVLDSVSTPYGKMFTSSTSNVLNIKNSTDYSLEWWSGDVGNTFEGKYFILNNPKRGLKTISFIPALQIGEDTVRTQYSNYDIINIQDRTLQLVDQTTFIKRDNLTSIRFNKKYIYKKQASNIW
jgi:hypothetical protein